MALSLRKTQTRPADGSLGTLYTNNSQVYSGLATLVTFSPILGDFSSRIADNLKKTGPAPTAGPVLGLKASRAACYILLFSQRRIRPFWTTIASSANPGEVSWPLRWISTL